MGGIFVAQVPHVWLAFEAVDDLALFLQAALGARPDDAWTARVLSGASPCPWRYGAQPWNDGARIGVGVDVHFPRSDLANVVARLSKK